MSNSDFEITGSGNPALVVIGPASAWEPIWNELATITKLIRYDSQDIEYRLSIKPPYSSAAIVKDLLMLIGANKIPQPFIIVGFSVSGLLAQLLARQHPESICGIILIDSMHPQQRNRFSNYSIDVGNNLLDELASGLPHLNFDEIENELHNAPTMRQNLPILVISRGVEGPMDVSSLWNELQTELAAMTKNSSRIIAKQSKHAIHFYEPELVIKEIVQFINRIQKLLG
jgi:hypothetical protein